MKILLEGLLPRVLPKLNFLCVSHDGAHDLERSIPIKLRAWREPGVRFVIVRDNDGTDCRQLKTRLRALCQGTHHADAVIRIACQELEAWYLGDAAALAEAFRDASLASIGGRARFRDPDGVRRPANALLDLVPSFQKVSGARAMGKTLAPDRTRSRSFQVFMEAVQRLSSAIENRIDNVNAGEGAS